MQWLILSLREHSEMALFLVLALGYGLGNLRFGKFKIGPIFGVLIAGIAVGQLQISVDEALQNTFFMFFLFAIGYQTGPQFFASLRATGLKQVVLTLVTCVSAFVLAVIASRLLRLDTGTAAGLFSGAMTGSAAFGSASNTIERMSISQAQQQFLLGKGAVSFAVCYLAGTVGVI